MSSSGIVTGTGLSVLVKTLQMDLTLGKRPVVADTLIGSYVWGRQVAEQHPNTVEQDLQRSIAAQHAIGLIKSLHT